MHKKTLKTLVSMLIVLSTLSGAALYAEEGQVEASYLYRLSSFTGIFPVSWAKIAVDASTDEIYVVSRTNIKIFNQFGMEVYSFNEGYELGAINDIAVDSKTGDILVLSYHDGRVDLIRCNFRGERISTIELKNLPPEFTGFSPNRLVLSGGSFYLASANDMKVIVTDDSGIFKKGYDLATLMQDGLSEKERAKDKDDYGMTGFSIDREGNILFTNSSMGKAFKLFSDSGELRVFGRRGSSAGKFGVPTDIVADATGKYILVADVLRCVVMVFDNDFKFYTEFGFRGLQQSNLIGPMYLAVDSKNKIYVSQLRNRGVSVYQFSAR